MKIVGYAWTWKAPAVKFGEKVYAERGAFADAIAKVESGKPMPLYWDHGHASMFSAGRHPIGRVTALREDRIGLRFEADIIDTEDARNTAAALRAGLVSGSSIGFNMDESKYNADPEKAERRLTSVALSEISVVNFPAHRGTSAWLVEDEPTINPPDGGTNESEK
jgi:HK97 family phage prohead protease